MKRVFLTLLFVLPTAIGAFFLPTPDEQPQQQGQLAGIDASLLVDARRATSNAASQAGFLIAGTQQLAEGTAQLQDKTGELVDGVAQINDGAQQLRDGLIQLQAGTGQMGDGATQIADGVENAVAQVQGLTVWQVQIVGALDAADAELAKIKDPAIPGLRKQLADLKAEAAKMGIDGEIADKLDKLRSGTRDLANQLAVPGYGFHDGMYKATQGSKQLADGTAKLNEGTSAAVDGIGQLNDGAAKVEQMAGLTNEKIAGISKAMPQSVRAANEAGEEVKSGLSPMVAFFLLAVVIAGALLGAGRWWIGIGGAAAAGLVGLWALDASGDQTTLAVAAITILLTAAASGASALAFRQLLGSVWGRAVAALAVVAQVGVVGRALSNDATANSVLGIAAKLMPLRYSVELASNYNNQTTVIVSCTVLGTLVVLGATLGYFMRRPVEAVEVH